MKWDKKKNQEQLILFRMGGKKPRRPGVAIFADIIKNITRFIRKIFKDSRKVKRI